jgi:hypothetical protein
VEGPCQISFLVISQGLAWKVGKGNSLRIGRDPWPGNNGQHILPQVLIDRLHEMGFFHLNQIADEQQTTIWRQGWKDAQALNLEEQLSVHWSAYIRSLQLSHIKIKDQDDELIWKFSPFGVYTPKDGYSFLMINLRPQAPDWWWKGVWKSKFH